MRTPAGVLRDVERRLQRTWAEEICGDEDAPRWPHRFPLSPTSSAALGEDFGAVVGAVSQWRAWASDHGAAIEDRSRRIGNVDHSIPSHLVVGTIDEAAVLVGGAWPGRLERGRVRDAELRTRFPGLLERASMLRKVDGFEDVDFELLLRAGAWFAEHSAAGLTPRQVPLEGFHAKWLNTRQQLVAALAGLGGLGLAPNHPSRIHFTYLDPDHLERGGRKHDSATVGDHFAPAYAPRVVIISENKDTALNFPAMPGSISIEGVGRGGATIAAFEWITEAPAVIYWGDMDADGLEILDGFRAAGVPARSILMDRDSFTRWEKYGTYTDQRGGPLRPRKPQPVSHLTEAERDLYFDLIDPGWSRVRRIEQERISLEVARDLIAAHTVSFSV
ncbi:Wadjet anti-phage system protein JetD domain-containing protein [Microbacterium sp. HJ5]